ncbi:AgmX/PglI C-terminal domain-containing protein [uncultured Desulfuromonas sp.]|uniref:AgmX/PglI C-terminal domain-containing protein n=1 Tax=uncultured Desulfuromonas sp. TaxID=181013 RepID=UPI00262E4DBD|nr:AgmX/PglI C-terminal domain-containing protein [uncultured Desulfuromonas sp.]
MNRSSAKKEEASAAKPAGGGQDGPGSLAGVVAQFFVFEREDYLGWDCFDKATVVIGKGPGADLVLHDPRIADIQVVVQVEDARVIIHDPTESGLARVNDEAVTTCLLGPLDAIRIGRYTIKVRLKPIKRKATRLQPVERETEGRKKVDPNTEAGPGVSKRRGDDIPPAPATSQEVQTVDAGEREEVVDSPETSSLPRVLRSWQARKAKRAKKPQPAKKPASADEAQEPLAGRETDTRPGSQETLRPPRAPEGPELPPSQEDPEILECLQTLTGGGADTPAEAGKPVDESGGKEERGAPEDPRGLHAPSAPRPLDAPRATRQPANGESPATPGAVPSTSWLGSPHLDREEDDEEEREDVEADFSLRDKLTAEAGRDQGRDQRQPVLQVIRTRRDQVVDIRYLGPKDKYLARGQRRPFCIAENGGEEGSFVFFDQEQSVAKILRDGQQPLEGDRLCVPANRAGRLRKVFRAPVPVHGRAVVAHGGDEYLIRRTFARPSPRVADAPRSGGNVLRTLATSTLFHLFVLLLAGMFVSLPGTDRLEPPEARFVQIDARRLEPPKKPPVEKKLAEVKPKPKKKPPVKTVRKASPKKTKVASKKAAPPQTRQVAKAAPASSPQAGNALNRNIKKEGILGALGISDGVQAGAKEALAAVTNIAAVSTSHASEGTLKVGGITGKLGSSKIEIPKMGLVNTRGATQVVASAGIAALDKGRTGRNQVMAMVSADLKAPVQIQGGMSREEVKKVIDAHMDEISYCYETALIEDPALMGKMAFEWRILTDGAVGEVRIKSSSVRSDSLHACIKRSIKSWDFPEPRGAEVMVSYPFIFDVVGF